MRLRLALSCFAASALLPLVAATPAEAAPCVTATRTVSGTIQGQDGRYVDALLGFDLIDAQKRHIDGRPGSSTFGCPNHHGYGVSIRVNRDLPATGSTTTGTKTWKVTIPANVTAMHVEVYPRAAGYGGTDESRYGHALRRRVPIPYGKSIAIELPLICPQGGKTGTINGWSSKGGVRKPLTRVAAWSLAPDNNTASPILGWNIGYAKSNGYFAVPNLPSGQYYTVQYTMDGVMKQKYNVYVHPCRGTYMSGSF